MSDRLLSVVVPVFNARNQLGRCVASLRRQTHPRLEVILVDDGSTDGSGAALDALATEDARLQVIHLPENGGIQAARTAGVRRATGDYIAFVDADDWVDPGMYRALLAHAEAAGADIAVCGAQTAYANNTFGRAKVHFRRHRVVDDQLLERFCRLEFGSGVLWNKLYRADVIRPPAEMVLGRELESGEDYIVNIGCFARARRVVLLPDDLYYYFCQPNSVSRAVCGPTRFVRLMTAYVVCLETHAGALRPQFAMIDALYARQLRLQCYALSSFTELLDHEGELRALLQRLAVVHPAGIYSLVHTFNVAAGIDRGGFRSAVRAIARQGHALRHAVQHVF